MYNMSQSGSFVHAAIDVSKAHLDLFCPRTGYRRFSYDDAGMTQMLKLLCLNKVTRIEIEATGGYERKLMRQAWEKGLEVCLLNAGRVRQFARAKGLLAKTDKIDAKLILDYAEVFAKDLRTCEKPTKKQELLGAYVQRRDQLVRTRIAEENRLEKASQPEIVKLIKTDIAYISKQMEHVEQKIRQIVKRDPEMAEKARKLETVHGVGPTISATLLALMPELGTMNRKQVASLAGLAPMNCDSGQMRAERHIQAGRFDVRRCLYMGCLSAIRDVTKYRDRFEKLTARGKPSKLALAACMRCFIMVPRCLVWVSGWPGCPVWRL
jgi:transposase